jgi:hypothetical protein
MVDNVTHLVDWRVRREAEDRRLSSVGISFVVAHHYQPANHVKPAVTSVAAD